MADNITNLNEGFDVESLNATQGLIERLSVQLDDLMKQKKEVNNMLKSIFENDESLGKAEEVAKETKQKITQRKSELNESQEVKDLKSKLTDVKEDLKIVEESLNTHLVNYFQMTGSMAIDLPSGDEREFKLLAKLKPTKKSSE